MLRRPIIQDNNEKTTKNHGPLEGCRKQQSSMRKPGIPPARIPEITKSSLHGMTFTLTLWSKHRQRRVTTKWWEKTTAVKHESETWSKVKKTSRLRHAKRRLKASQPQLTSFQLETNASTQYSTLKESKSDECLCKVTNQVARVVPNKARDSMPLHELAFSLSLSLSPQFWSTTVLQSWKHGDSTMSK